MSRTMVRALQTAVLLERVSPQGEPWIAGTYDRTAHALHRRGLADEYRVTPNSPNVYYRISPAGREWLAKRSLLPEGTRHGRTTTTQPQVPDLRLASVRAMRTPTHVHRNLRSVPTGQRATGRLPGSDQAEAPEAG